ncbi:MAG: hypothetical protein ACJ71Y_11380 [Blastococcus sp.]
MGAQAATLDDATAYWNDAPPAMSPRCGYWLTRHNDGSWQPNRWIRREGYHAAAERLGVWIWEYLHVIRPLIEERGDAELGKLLDEKSSICNRDS